MTTVSSDRRTGFNERPLRVLVVEDHPFHQELAASLLTVLGCEVVVAGDGAEGVRWAHDRVFDLIVMDRHMPLCDGDRATRLIRRSGCRSKRAKVVCYSTDPPTRGEDVYDEVIAKPMNMAGAIGLLALLPNTPRSRGS